MNPLAGKRVAMTRSTDQSDQLRRRLEAEGAIPLQCATITTLPPESYGELDAVLQRLSEYGWVAFTSGNAATKVVDRMAETGVPLTRLSDRRVAAVGPATKAVLEEHGVGVSHVPDQYLAVRLAESIPSVLGERVLLPQGDIAGSVLPSILSRRGALPEEVTVYRTISVAPVAEAVEVLRRGVDALTFTSASTVRGFLKLGPEWRDILGGAIVATIGPATSAAAREAGIIVHAEAVEHTVEGVVQALAQGFQHRERQPSGGTVK